MAIQVSPSAEQRQRVHECREALEAAQRLCERLEMLGDQNGWPLIQAKSIRDHVESLLREALKPFAEQPA